MINCGLWPATGGPTHAIPLPNYLYQACAYYLVIQPNLTRAIICTGFRFNSSFRMVAVWQIFNSCPKMFERCQRLLHGVHWFCDRIWFAKLLHSNCSYCRDTFYYSRSIQNSIIFEIVAFWQIFVSHERNLLYTFARDIYSYALILQFAYKATKNVMALHRPNFLCIVKMILPSISFSPE